MKRFIIAAIVALAASAQAQSGTDIFKNILQKTASSTSPTAQLTVQTSRGTTAAPTTVLNNDVVWRVNVTPYSNAYTSLGYMQMLVNGTPGASDMPGRFQVLLSPDGSATPALVLDITQDKAVLIPGSLTVTGAITASGGIVGAVADGSITLAKLADLAQDQFIGRTTASTGVPQTATITAAARTVLDDTTVGAMVDTLGGASATGTGGLVRATSPTFVTPNIGAATASTLDVDGGFAGGGLTVSATEMSYANLVTITDDIHAESMLLSGDLDIHDLDLDGRIAMAGAGYIALRGGSDGIGGNEGISIGLVGSDDIALDGNLLAYGYGQFMGDIHVGDESELDGDVAVGGGATDAGGTGGLTLEDDGDLWMDGILDVENSGLFLGSLSAGDGFASGGVTLTNTGDGSFADDVTVTGELTVGSFADGEINALAGLTSAANKVPRYSGSGTAALITLRDGTYTPTTSGTVNVTTSTAYISRYTQIGNRVTVYITIDITPAVTTTTTAIELSLPVASNFSNFYELTGNASSFNNPNGAILYGLTTDKAYLTFTSNGTTSVFWHGSFSYDEI